MKNIYAPKRFYIALLIFAIVMMSIGLFISCTTNKPQHNTDVVQNNNRFQTVYFQHFDFGGGSIYIIVDKETNVKYMYFKNGYGAGLTKLEE